jgi:hypothetical protein
MLEYIHELLNHNASRSLPKYALLIKQEKKRKDWDIIASIRRFHQHTQHLSKTRYSPLRSATSTTAFLKLFVATSLVRNARMKMLKYIHESLNHNVNRSLPKYALLTKQQKEKPWYHSKQCFDQHTQHLSNTRYSPLRSATSTTAFLKLFVATSLVRKAGNMIFSIDLSSWMRRLFASSCAP